MSDAAPSEKLRLFIALPVPDAVKAAAREVQRELIRRVPGEGLRWTGPDQFHLTLQFLGGVESSRLAALIAALREACRGLDPFPLRVARLGFFPSEHRPRVLWAGVHCGTDHLRRLQEAVHLAMRDFAEKQEEREFTAHLTLARVKNLRPAEARALAEGVKAMADRVLGEWTAQSVELIRSELTTAGSRYTCLEGVALTAAA